MHKSILYCLAAVILPVYVYSQEAVLPDGAENKEKSALADTTAVAALADTAAVKETPRLPAAETKVINGIECVLVKAGKFVMGSPIDKAHGSNETQHLVTLTKDYWIGKYEITQAQYAAVMGGHPSNFIGDSLPVENVSWNEAVDFCKKIGARLPTEAEWEFAARGGNESKGYIYSGGDDLNEVGWYEDNSDYETKPVGTKAPNELGIHDMSGNVWEWCSDWYGNYPADSVVDPKGPANGTSRVCRGSCWNSNEDNSYVTHRSSISPTKRYRIFGFRVVFNANAADLAGK